MVIVGTTRGSLGGYVPTQIECLIIQKDRVGGHDVINGHPINRSRPTSSYNPVAPMILVMTNKIEMNNGNLH